MGTRGTVSARGSLIPDTRFSGRDLGATEGWGRTCFGWDRGRARGAWLWGRGTQSHHWRRTTEPSGPEAESAAPFPGRSAWGGGPGATPGTTRAGRPGPGRPQGRVAGGPAPRRRPRGSGAPRPRSGACATHAPCATPSGHSAVPPFRRRSFPKPRGRHFTARPTAAKASGRVRGVTRGGGRPAGSARPRCPAARLAAGGADSNPGPPPRPRGVPLRLRLAPESYRPPAAPGPSEPVPPGPSPRSRQVPDAGGKTARHTHPSLLTRECEGERPGPA